MKAIASNIISSFARFPQNGNQVVKKKKEQSFECFDERQYVHYEGRNHTLCVKQRQKTPIERSVFMM